MADPEYLQDRNQPIRTEVIGQLGKIMRDQAGIVQLPVHVADETTPVGPVPVVGGQIPRGRDLDTAHIYITHHGRADGETRYRVHSRPQESAQGTRGSIWGNGMFEVSGSQGSFTRPGGEPRPLQAAGYRRLALVLRKTVFTEADTWRAIYDLRLNDKLVSSQQITDETRSPHFTGAWRWLNKHFLGPIGDIPPQTWMWY